MTHTAAEPAGDGQRSFEFFAMGTPCRITIEDTPADLAQHAAQAAIEEVRRIEAKYSRYRGDSIVSRINAAAGDGRLIEVDDETAGLLDFARDLHALSDGLFDPTTGVLRTVWNFAESRVPGFAEVQAVLARVGWHRVAWQRPRIALAVPGMTSSRTATRTWRAAAMRCATCGATRTSATRRARSRPKSVARMSCCCA